MHSGITPGGAWGTIWDAGDRTRVGRVQGKRPTRCAIAPAPYYYFRLSFLLAIIPGPTDLFNH